MNDAALTAALQLADSALPIGRHAHSYGLETILVAGQDLDHERLADIVRAHVHESVAPLDGRALLLAHEAAARADRAALCALDRSVTVHKTVAGSRAASTACGRRLLRLGRELAPDAALLRDYAARAEADEDGADGNVAVVTGALAQALGVPARAALLIELRSAAAALLAAAVRLGRLAATPAQVLLRRLDPDLAEAASHCQATIRDPFSSSTPELDVAGLAHRRLAGRQFAS